MVIQKLFMVKQIKMFKFKVKHSFRWVRSLFKHLRSFKLGNQWQFKKNQRKVIIVDKLELIIKGKLVRNLIIGNLASWQIIKVILIIIIKIRIVRVILIRVRWPLINIFYLIIYNIIIYLLINLLIFEMKS